MQLVSAYRANKILFNFIKSNQLEGEVLLPANICQEVVDTLRYAGMELHFLDISPDTFCIDEEQVLQHASSASLLIFVHSYGVETDFGKFFWQVREINRKIAIVDDRCLCMPSFAEPAPDADLVIFSTSAKKQVNLGIGGFGWVADNQRYREMDVDGTVLTNQPYALSKNLILDNSLLIAKHKEHLNSIYRENLPQEIQLPDMYHNWRFQIRTACKDQIIKELFAAGLFASGHYRSLGMNCPVAEALCQEIVNLFNDQYYTEEQAIETCRIINRIIK